SSVLARSCLLTGSQSGILPFHTASSGEQHLVTSSHNALLAALWLPVLVSHMLMGGSRGWASVPTLACILVSIATTSCQRTAVMVLVRSV
ncbi:hypothetical protein HaLaN_30931, partial [Haematococcus lacustris]